MSNPSKQKGTKAETKVVRFLKEHGLKAERKALSGCKDCGDIKIDVDGEEIILEVKAGKQTQNPNRTLMRKWMDQAIEEAENAGTSYYALVLVRYGRSIKDAEVWTEMINGCWSMTYLDKFIEVLGYVQQHLR